MNPTPSLPASPELPESVRQAIKQAVADILPNDNADSCHEAFVHVVKALTPLWPSADGRGKIIGMTPGWVPTFNDPDNSSGAPEAEPIYEGDATPSPVAGLPTPETDAAKFPASWKPSKEWVYAEDCASLERRLGAARAEVADLKGALEIATRSADDQMRQKREAEAQLATAKEKAAELASEQGRVHDVLLTIDEVPHYDDKGVRGIDEQVKDMAGLYRQLQKNCLQAFDLKTEVESELAKANAAVEVLSTARTAIERSLEGAASFDGYYRHHRNAIAMMDKLGVKPVKENNDHGF